MLGAADDILMFANGTSMLYLIECSSWTTTFDTFLNDNFRLVEPAKCLTCNVLKRKGWKLKKKNKITKRQKIEKIGKDENKVK